MKNKTLDYINNSLDGLTGKTVVVTGANSGLGFEMCNVLLMKNAHVVMACRSLKRATEAKEQLLLKHKNGLVDIILYDQSSYKSIDNFTEELVKTYPDFYGLILNAGILKPTEKKVNKEELDFVIKVNAMGTIRIIENMQEFLANSILPRRIIIQSSITGRIKNYYSLEKIQNKSFGRFKGYAISKSILHSAYSYYQNENPNDCVEYYLSEPGICNTNILRNFKKGFQKIANAFLNLVCHDNITGCLTALTCLNEINKGTYYVPKHLGIKGLPTIGNYKEKYKNEKLIVQILDEKK